MAKNRIQIPALRVDQWLPSWNSYRFDAKEHQAEPEHSFLMFSLNPSHLKALTGVYRRSVREGMPRALDQNIQRGHEEDRSDRIRSFVEDGYPWCDLGDRARAQADELELKKPGWLPTAIIINMLKPGDTRNGTKISENDVVSVSGDGPTRTISLPQGFNDEHWKPKTIFPFEVIDGQHRLWAFEDLAITKNFSLPVVAFHGLDRGWQAYLFWSINITPKRINRSLAFDLYPLLRQQTWLDRVAGIPVYRETRCQELVEALWGNPESPWYRRINMLGESKERREYK